MRHGKKGKKLGRTKEHRRALLKNLCRSLFIFEKIKTTLPKAKEARSLAEHLIEFAKRNDLPAKRTIYRFIPDHKLVKIVCEEIAPRFKERQGGYTRVYRLGPRLGDGAEMAILELVEQGDPSVVALRRKLIQQRVVVEGKVPKKEKKKEKKKKEPKKPEKRKDTKTKEKPTKKAKKATKKKEKKAKQRARAKKSKKKK